MKLAVKFNGKGKVSRAVQPVCGKGPELAADESACPGHIWLNIFMIKQLSMQ